MHSLPAQRSQRRYPYILLAIITVVCILHSAALSQGSGRESTGTGGNHIVTGKIFFPSGRRADGTIQVKLTSYTSSDITVIADSSGSFTFTSIAPGEYTVAVNAGKEYEIAREHVTADQDIRPPRSRGDGDIQGASASPTRRYTVMITRQPKPSENRNRPSVINAALAEVPDDARALYEKALTLSQNGDTANAID